MGIEAKIYGWCERHPEAPITIREWKRGQVCQSGMLCLVASASSCRTCAGAGGRWLDADWFVPCGDSGDAIRNNGDVPPFATPPAQG